MADTSINPAKNEQPRANRALDGVFVALGAIFSTVPGLVLGCLFGTLIFLFSHSAGQERQREAGIALLEVIDGGLTAQMVIDDTAEAREAGVLAQRAYRVRLSSESVPGLRCSRTPYGNLDVQLLQRGRFAGLKPLPVDRSPGRGAKLIDLMHTVCDSVWASTKPAGGDRL